MTPYRDIDKDSNVSAYEYGGDWIQVQFKDGSVYEYTSSSAGQGNIDTMKQLAVAGEGLNSHIQRYVRKGYSRKMR